MITRNADLPRLVKPAMMGGKGELLSIPLLQPDQFCNKGRLFMHATLKPGSSIGKHTHEKDFEVYYILSGTGTYHDGDEVYTVSTGDQTFCPAGHSHALENTGTEDLHFIALILYA